MNTFQDCKNLSFDYQKNLMLSNENYINLNYEGFYRLLKYLSKFLHFSNAHLFIRKSNFLKLLFSYPFLQNPSENIELHLPSEIIDDLFEKEGIQVIDSNDYFKRFFKFPDIQNESILLISPVKYEDVHLGLLIFSEFEGDYYRKFEYSEFEDIFFQLNFLFYNFLVSEKEIRKSKLIEKINNICHNLDSFIDEGELFENLVRCIQENLNYNHVGLYLVNKKEQKITLKAISGNYENYVPRNQELNFYTGIVGQVIKSGKTILSNNTKQNPHFLNLTPEITPTQSELCVPIIIEDDIIGAINIESTELMEFDQDDLNSLEVLANRVGTKIYNNQLFHEIQQSNKKLYDIVSSMGQGIILLDNFFNIKWINETASKWHNGDLINKFCANSICSKEIFDSGCPGMITMSTGKITKRTIRLMNGKYYNVTCAPIKEVGGSSRKVVELFDDITNSIEMQHRLDEAKKQLQQTKYLAALGELTTSIAHEIRNPLNAISNAISVFDENLDFDENNLLILNIVKEETTRLNNIISKYLQFGKFPDISLSENDIIKTIEQIIHLIKLDKELADRIEFISEFDSNIPKLLFDQEAIKQVLWNLIINSISAIKRKGFIKISVKMQNGNVIIKIEDNGIGIPENKITKIFNQFYSIKKTGVGMGLSIVKRILDKHDWIIKVESIYRTGTTFIIKIPIN